MKKFLLVIFIIVLAGVFIPGTLAHAESPKDKVRCGPIDTRENCVKLHQSITELIDPWGTCAVGDANATRTIPAYKTECLSISGTFSLGQTTDGTYTPVCKPSEELKNGKCIPSASDPNYYLLSPLPCENGSSSGCV